MQGPRARRYLISTLHVSHNKAVGKKRGNDLPKMTRRLGADTSRTRGLLTPRPGPFPHGHHSQGKSITLQWNSRNYEVLYTNVWILVLLTRGVILTKLFNLSWAQLRYLKNGYDNVFLIRLMCSISMWLGEVLQLLYSLSRLWVSYLGTVDK